MRSLRSILLLALLPCLALAFGATLSWPFVSKWHGDLQIYAGYAEQLVSGKIPYRDFLPEYPPLALLPFVLPRLLIGGAALTDNQFRALFLLGNLVYLWVLAVAILGVARVAGKQVLQAALALTLLVAILSPFLAWRFDLFPAMLTALALFALVRGQALIGGVWLGLGVAAKLYPLVLSPIAALDLIVLRRWRALCNLAFGVTLALAITVGPFLLLEPAGLLHFLVYHEQRGIQIESLAGGIVCLGRVLGLTEVDVVFNYGALHLVSPWADALLPWLTPLLVSMYAAVFGIAWRSRMRLSERNLDSQQRANWLVNASCAALLVFVVTNKVFSPQYLAWLLPFAPLLAPRQVALAALICLATVILFPFKYDALLGFAPRVVLLLNGRNLAIVALLGLVLYRLIRPQQTVYTYASSAAPTERAI